MCNKAIVNDIPVSGQPPTLDIDTAQKLSLFSLLYFKSTN